MKDRAGNEMREGDRVLFLVPGRSNSRLEWGTVHSFTPKMVRVLPGLIDNDARYKQDSVLREPRSVVIPRDKDW